MVYVLTLSISAIFAYGYDRTRDKRKMFLYFFLAMLIPTTLMAFRYGVGQDYFYTYVPVFNSILYGTNTGIEWGYYFLNKLCQVFTDDSQSIFILTSLIFCLCIAGAMRHHIKSGTLFLSMYIFIAGGFYLYSFNVVRQCMAVAIFCFAIKYIYQKKPIQYFTLICLAALIHKSALIYIPIYFIVRREYHLFTYLFILLLIKLFSPQIVQFIGKFLEGTKYYNYISGYYADSSSNSITASQLLNIFVFIIIIYIEKRNKVHDKMLCIFGNIHFVGIIFTMFMGLIPLIFRMSNLFYLIQFLSVPYIVGNYVPKKLRWIAYASIISVYGLLFIHTLITNGNNILPYQFFF